MNNYIIIVAIITFPLPAFGQTQWPSAENYEKVWMDKDTVVIKGYEIRRYSELDSIGDRIEHLDISDGESVVFRTKEYGRENFRMINFGLFPVISDGDSQLIVEQWSGGMHCCYSDWIIDLSDEIRILFDNSQKDSYTHSASVRLIDINVDHNYEIVLYTAIFGGLFLDLCTSCYPTPDYVLEFNEDSRSFQLTSSKYEEYLLRGLRVKNYAVEERRKVAKPYDDYKGKVYYFRDIVAVMGDYIFAGKREKAWKYFYRWYDLDDKDEKESEIRAALKNSSIYLQMYNE